MTLPDKPEGTVGWPWDAPVEGAGRGDSVASDALPTIGVVVPSFNQGQFLEATLRSLFLQGYPRLHVVVMDGGSTDGSVEILQRYGSLLTRWVSEPDAGQSDAIQRGITGLECEVAGWLNSDDVLVPGALMRVGTHFARNGQCQWLTGDGVFVGEDGHTEQYVHRPSAWDFDTLLDYGGGKFLPQPSVFFRLVLFERVGGVDKSLRYSMDLDLWLRMRAVAVLDHLPYALSRLRQHQDAKTLRDNERAMQEIERVLRRHMASRPLRVRVRPLRHIRQALARSAVSRALQAHFEGDGPASRAALMRAARAYPPAIVGRAFVGALARNVLPRAVRARVMRRP